MSVLRTAIRRSGHVTAFSEPGALSTFSLRQRYTILLKSQTDPTLSYYYYDNMVHAWFADPPSYAYWWVTSMAMGLMVGILSRHWFFNPDLYGRRQEVQKPFPDRHRQFGYCLPYFNHRMRNYVLKYKWCVIDNEPDYGDKHPLGYRPDRAQSHRRFYMFFHTTPRYSMQDPLFTSTLHGNMEKMYQEIGYTKKPKGEDDEEE